MSTFPAPGLSYDAGGQLQWNGQLLSALAEPFSTPLYAYDSTTLAKPLQELQAGLAGLSAKVCFAVKANSNLTLLSRFKQWGAGADIVSGGELFRALRAGVPASEIVFSGVGKTRDEISAALRAPGGGVRSFNVESLSELRLINEVAREKNQRAPVALRFNPDVDAKTHPYISTGLRKNKFGLTRSEVLEAFRARTQFSHCDLSGLSTHIGSQMLTLAPLDQAFKRMREMADEIRKITGRPLRWLDLGGGIGVRYDREKPPTPSQYARLIQKHFGARSPLKAQMPLFLEPGRLLCAQGGVLITRVLFKKTRGKKTFLVVDAAMTELLRPTLYGSHHTIVPLQKPRSKKTVTYDVVGPVCESSDFLAQDRKLPAEIAEGDLLAVLTAGAYGFSMASQYNSRPRVAEVLLGEGAPRVIRKRESFEDLIQGE